MYKDFPISLKSNIKHILRVYFRTSHRCTGTLTLVLLMGQLCITQIGMRG